MLTKEGREARREYERKWREKNKEAVKAYQRKWQKANPDKVRAAKERYWNRVAEMNKEAESESQSELFDD